MPVTQLTYLSRNTYEGVALDEQLGRILDVSRRNNGRDGLTGYLVSDGAWFLQILEGDGDRLAAALARIRDDERHGDMRVLSTRQVRTRSFPQWSMGGSLKTPPMRAIFRRHGLERIDPDTLTAPAILLLMMDLQDFERAEDARRAG
jgi:Sensors of blue-light using FAD